MSLAGKVAIITGAARGIGRATALELARRGADIAVNDLPATHPPGVIEEIRALGQRAVFAPGDVSDRVQVESVINAAIGQLGRIDILVNNAAASVRKPFLELEAADV